MFLFHKTLFDFSKYLNADDDDNIGFSWGRGGGKYYKRAHTSRARGSRAYFLIRALEAVGFKMLSRVI